MLLVQKHPSNYAPVVVTSLEVIGGDPGVWTTGLVSNGLVYRSRTSTNSHYEYPFSMDDETVFDGSIPANSIEVSNGRLIRASGFNSVAKAVFSKGAVKQLHSLNFATFPGSITQVEATGAVADGYLDFSSDIVSALLSSGDSASIYIDGTRNLDSFWPHAELTAIPYRTNRANSGTLCAVPFTRRHCVTAKHYHLAVGDTITWKTLANADVTIQVIGYAAVDWSDLAVLTLASDLPESITPLPVVGEWFASADLNSSTNLPQHSGIFQDQFHQCCFGHIANHATFSAYSFSGTWNGFDESDYIPKEVIITTSEATRILPSMLNFYNDFKYYAESGDSGLSFLAPIANGGWAIVGPFYFPTAVTFVFEDIMNALIIAADTSAGVSTGYTVTVAPDPTA